jgi:hypothetical protein
MTGFKILPPLVSFLIVSKKASYPKWFKENYVKKSVGGCSDHNCANCYWRRYYIELSNKYYRFKMILILKFTKTTFGQQELSTNDLVAITITIIALIILLLFPNLQKIRISPYEIEIMPTDNGPVGRELTSYENRYLPVYLK